MSEKISLDSSVLFVKFFTTIVRSAVPASGVGVGSTLGIGSSSFEHAANTQAIIVPNNKFLSSIGEWL